MSESKLIIFNIYLVIRINRAYEVLSDPVKRERYDRYFRPVSLCFFGHFENCFSNYYVSLLFEGEVEYQDELYREEDERMREEERAKDPEEIHREYLEEQRQLWCTKLVIISFVTFFIHPVVISCDMLA